MLIVWNYKYSHIWIQRPLDTVQLVLLHLVPIHIARKAASRNSCSSQAPNLTVTGGSVGNAHRQRHRYLGFRLWHSMCGIYGTDILTIIYFV